MRERQSLRPESRPIFPEYLARLKAIVAKAGSVTGARTRLGTSPEVVEGALSGGKFRPSTLERLEAAIDRLEPPQRAAG
jgi:hypothetical protein